MDSKSDTVQHIAWGGVALSTGTIPYLAYILLLLLLAMKSKMASE